MCGICGVVQLGGDPREVVPPDVLDGMTDAMTHRGPNDRGTYAEPGVALGVRRLSIVDVEGGHQPFANEDARVWAIQNGELYNHLELRKELAREGHVLESRCDTEVLPHLYERDGAAFPKALRGKFGLAVWDAERRCVVVARDRLGVKPLYYASVGDLVVFASELKSLLASGLVPFDLDYEAISTYLVFGFVPGPRTPFAAVSKLLPGHLFVAGPDGLHREAYWSHPEPAPGPVEAGVDHYAEELLTKLDESVRLRLMSDVPLGAMLSGGVDSSLVVALMARHMSEPVKTFSIGFVEAGKTNELADARLVASAFGTEHHELELSFAEQTVDLAELVWSLDEPLADLSALGFLALSELAARHVTVALSGQGADELYGGYLKHQAAALCARWLRLPAPVRRVERLAPLARGRFRRAARTLAAPDGTSRLLAMSSKLDGPLSARLLKGPLAKRGSAPAEAAVRALVGGLEDSDPLATTLFLDAQLALVDDMLHYFDRASMAHSLEVRVPFLDHEVVEHAATIPTAFKIRRLQTKHVLKHAARGLLPDRIVDKPKLGFFREEVDEWFRAQTRGAISDYLLGPSPRYADILDRGEVERLVRGHSEGRAGGRQYLLLSILVLEVWLAEFLPRAARAAERPGGIRVSA